MPQQEMYARIILLHLMHSQRAPSVFVIQLSRKYCPKKPFMQLSLVLINVGDFGRMCLLIYLLISS